MTSLEPILAVLVGAAFTAAATFAVQLIEANKALKYGTLLSRVYDILDPLLERNMRSWSGSDVEFAIELVIEAVADNQLTVKEIKHVAQEAAMRWLPQVAADKVRKYETMMQEPAAMKASNILAEVVTGSKTKEEAFTEVKQILANG